MADVEWLYRSALHNYYSTAEPVGFSRGSACATEAEQPRRRECCQAEQEHWQLRNPIKLVNSGASVQIAFPGWPILFRGCVMADAVASSGRFLSTSEGSVTGSMPC